MSRKALISDKKNPGAIRGAFHVASATRMVKGPIAQTEACVALKVSHSSSQPSLLVPHLKVPEMGADEVSVAPELQRHYLPHRVATVSLTSRPPPLILDDAMKN